jgi:DNA polymerase-1
VTSTHVIETGNDLLEFDAWLRDRPLVAVDTEGTGLDIFSGTFRLRLVQFGDAHTAYVIPVELSPEFARAAAHALHLIPHLIAHNATFDLLIFDRHLSVPLETTFPKTTDTRILSHLIDPRGKPEGGIGHALKDLSAHYIDPSAPDTQAGLTKTFTTLGFTKTTGWAHIPTDHPTYNLYAGLDVILTSRLHHKLSARVAGESLTRLAEFEHSVARVCALMERCGFLTDLDYTALLTARLADEAESAVTEAHTYGLSNINSTAQLSTALTAMGETLTKLTPSGSIQVDKAVLRSLPTNPLAQAVLRAKRALKWRVAYADAIRTLTDPSGRLHPKINSLQARTGRMSINRPPLQQLPSSDWTIRRCLIADPGTVVCSVDFKAVELRVLAALAQDTTLMAAIHAGEDLHSTTARLIFGEVTPATRKIGKMTNFLTVYGGGTEALSSQAGITLTDAHTALAGFRRAYPGIQQYSRKLIREGQQGARALYTVTGRRLPLDRDRLYAAVNYQVQSTARDVFAQALLNVDGAGLTEYLRLPVHDELVFCAPRDSAADLAHEIGNLMSMKSFMGVPIDTEATVGGPSWGSLYDCPASEDAA